MTDFQDLGEFGFIDRIANRDLVRTTGVVCGIGDDCAVLESAPGQVLLITTDTMVEGVHFSPDVSPEHLGHKLIAVSLSDIAAMGGEPRDAVVSVAVPANTPSKRVEGIYDGLYRSAALYDTNIVGGDTVRSTGPLILSLTLAGRMQAERVCYRSGARPGDCLYVSDTLGDSAAGLKLILGDKVDQKPKIADSDRAALLRRHHLPIPRVGLGRSLADTGAVTAMIDISDGLSSDLLHICDRSDVSAVVAFSNVPLSSSLQAYATASGVSARDLVLSGGEDYELLFTVAPDKTGAIDSLASDPDLPPLTRIGRVEEGPPGIHLEDAEGVVSALEPQGFDHFKTP
jgi:thiamine-monophosphate kinase